MFEMFAAFRKYPQHLRIVSRSESPQISAILRKTCAKSAVQQLRKPARKISHVRMNLFQCMHVLYGMFIARAYATLRYAMLRYASYC